MGSLGEDDLIINITSFMSMKNSLKLNLQKSKTLGLALQQSEPRLEQINQRLPRLESAVRPIGAQPDALDTVSGHINKAVVPAAAVLKVFDAIHGLEKSLSDPKSDLSGYLKVLGNLRGAVKFLSDNCGMAVEWLGDIVEYLEDYNVADKRYISSLKNAITRLKDLQHEEKGCFDGGLLAVSLDRLEDEFRRLLTENSVPLPMSSSPLKDEQACISPSPLPVPVIKKLQDIIGSLIVNNRLERCNIQGYITKWSEHLEFAVKHLFEAEYKLCNDVFEKLGLDVWRDCFANIAAQAGMLAFLQFGKTVTESKKDPIKLLKLLDIFAALNRLRLDFNRLFGGAACAEIQNLTRDLIKSLIEGASEIFWELLLQVELQRQSPPPPDGSVPRLVSFIIEYSNRLLGNDYKPILNQVLAIERSWKREKFHERLVHDELLNLIRAVELNLDTWSKAYNDAHLSFVFLMNNHWHLYKHLNATTIGALLGDQWLRGHQEETEYYSTIFLKESWGKLPSHLTREGLILFSGGRATARDLVKKRLKAFNEAFDNIYQKNSKWVILDKDLREKTLQVIIQTIVPVYRSYMQNYGPLVEQDLNAGKYVKFTAQSLEKTISSLFLPKPVRHGSFKVRQRSRKFSNGVEEQLSASPTPTIASA
ncbi:putative exocyst complex component Exo70, cullin repeat-like-containing domain superfamily [Helianthus debilis subsp. tardiflorus]